MKRSNIEKVGNGINLTILFLLCLSMFVPFYLTAINSFAQEKDIILHGYSLFPEHFTLDSYKFIFSGTSRFFQALKLTIFITIVGTFVGVFLSATTGYAMSRKDLPGRNKIMGLIVFTMFFGPGLIPYAILITKIGLVDNVLVLIIPGMFNAWNMILMRNYFMSLPKEMRESAEIDGASEGVTLFKIILPVSKPIIATIVLFTAVGSWGRWFECAFFVNDEKLYTLQYLLLEILNRAQAVQSSSQSNVVMLNETIKFATIMVTVVPILLVYPFVQKYFVNGIMIGSLKG